jgi:hypothetical protein
MDPEKIAGAIRRLSLGNEGTREHLLRTPKLAKYPVCLLTLIGGSGI